jgi:glycosyltransferase involved in cell wall biosynthesis
VPFISVIITAHNRREFLLEAVNSALNQTLPKDEYEIIVVKNFEDERIDKFLEEHNVKNIVTKEEPLGAKIVKGVEESRGEVVSFLDDDDLWLPQKLEIVKQVFKDKDVIYYHNNFLDFNKFSSLSLLIDRIQSSNIRRKISKLKIYDIKNDLFVQINDSSIAVRKKIFNKNILDRIKNVSSAFDVLLFYLAYCHDGDFVFDNKILTLRRLHNTNTSIDRLSDYEDWLYNLSKMSLKYMNAYSTFLNIFTSFECEIPDKYKEKLISHLEARYLGFKVTYSRLPNTKNELTLKELVKYLKYQRSLKSFLYGFLPFAPKRIKEYTIKKWYYYNLSVRDQMNSNRPF